MHGNRENNSRHLQIAPLLHSFSILPLFHAPHPCNVKSEIFLPFTTRRLRSAATRETRILRLETRHHWNRKWKPRTETGSWWGNPNVVAASWRTLRGTLIGIRALGMHVVLIFTLSSTVMGWPTVVRVVGRAWTLITSRVGGEPLADCLR